MTAAPLALYRRYRPETFAEVIGQEHVTLPLIQALRSGRASHAYLFSGPRGCGKTSSARILARCLNCEQGPTPAPCGECDSCVGLARNGAGSIDVIEIDAASHGGVDDARDLRERAAFGPAESRYKIYIIDEAHMVTPAGFNALLKIVEEPPEHVKFIFATTEPEKVIGTIRSRTHHYPFRLVPPATLTQLLETVCGQEGIAADKGVLPLVTRAGAGSVRDSLSVLYQLIAGAQEGKIAIERASALLGFTDSALIDEMVSALAEHDAAAAYQAVDRVVESGQDPRRFVEDLLERMRDLMVCAALRGEADKVLHALPADALARAQKQAAKFGPGELTHAGEVLHTGLNAMTGATPARLHLEMLVARLTLPALAGESGYAARLDRLERGQVQLNQQSAKEQPKGPAPQEAPTPQAKRPAPKPIRPAPQAAPAPMPEPEQAGPPRPSAPKPEPKPAAAAVSPPETQTSAETQQSVDPAPRHDASSDKSAVDSQPADSQLPIIAQAWEQILQKVALSNRVTHALVGPHTKLVECTEQTLWLAASTPKLAVPMQKPIHAAVLQQAIKEVLQLEVQVRFLGPDERPNHPAKPTNPSANGSPQAETQYPETPSSVTRPRPSRSAPAEPASPAQNAQAKPPSPPAHNTRPKTPPPAQDTQASRDAARPASPTPTKQRATPKPSAEEQMTAQDWSTSPVVSHPAPPTPAPQDLHSRDDENITLDANSAAQEIQAAFGGEILAKNPFPNEK